MKCTGEGIGDGSRSVFWGGKVCILRCRCCNRKVFFHFMGQCHSQRLNCAGNDQTDLIL